MERIGARPPKQTAFTNVNNAPSEKLLKENGFALLTVNGDEDRPNAFMPLEHLLTSLEISHRLVVLEDTDHNLGKYYDRAGDTMLKFLAEQLNRHSEPALR